MCRGAKLLGWTTIVADARAKFATRERIPSADELIVEWPQEALAQVQPDHQTAIVVLTHDDKFDEPALDRRTRDGGLLHRRARLAAEPGAAPRAAARGGCRRGVALDRIMGPCGLDVGADTQEETALSILAEILAVRAQREGGFLKHAKQRIHVEVE